MRGVSDSMATGRDNQLTRQIDESLVVAELGQRGFVATAFAGNVPDFDILAIGPDGRSLPIQVKAIRSTSWQFDIRSFLEIQLTRRGQVIKGKTRPAHKDLLCILVKVKEDRLHEFFLLRWRHLQNHFYRTYKGRKPPKDSQSFHCAIWPKELQKHKDNWRLLSE